MKKNTLLYTFVSSLLCCYFCGDIIKAEVYQSRADYNEVSFLFNYKKEMVKNNLREKNKNNNSFFYSVITNDYYCSSQTWVSDMIDLDDAWIYQGSNTIRIGIIDTGIDVTHPDLVGKINTALSYSFIDDEPLIDYTGHGTSVAGIIGANKNNNIGIYGINSNVELVSLKVSNSLTTSNPTASANDIASAINYAQANGIKLINASVGVNVSTTALQTAVSNYSGLIVCAAGNDHFYIDDPYYYIYPQCYSNDNLLVVGANDQDDAMTVFTNYGACNVDLFAPGKDIMSTVPATINSSNYSLVSGTSYAAPIVTGVVSLLLSRYPCISATELKADIMNSVDLLIGSMPYFSSCASHGRLNARESIKLALNHIHYQAINNYYHEQYCSHQSYGYFPHNWVLSTIFPMSTYQPDYIPNYVCSDCGMISMGIPV